MTEKTEFWYKGVKIYDYQKLWDTNSLSKKVQLNGTMYYPSDYYDSFDGNDVTRIVAVIKYEDFGKK